MCVCGEEDAAIRAILVVRARPSAHSSTRLGQRVNLTQVFPLPGAGPPLRRSLTFMGIRPYSPPPSAVFTSPPSWCTISCGQQGGTQACASTVSQGRHERRPGAGGIQRAGAQAVQRCMGGRPCPAADLHAVADAQHGHIILLAVVKEALGHAGRALMRCQARGAASGSLGTEQPAAAAAGVAASRAGGRQSAAARAGRQAGFLPHPSTPHLHVH